MLDLESLVSDIVEIAKIPSPTFGEGPRIAWLTKRLGSSPGRRYRDDVGNLVWRWGAGNRCKLLLTAHVDSVFPESTDIDIERRGPILFGPGVGDNAAAIAATLTVVETLLHGSPLEPGAVVFTVCEEGLGNLRGAHRACQDLVPENVIAVEGHGLDEVVADALGSVRCRISVDVPGGHSWLDRGTLSAIHELLAVAHRLLAGATPDEPVNIGLINGGIGVNSIAQHAELLAEQRALDPVRLDAFEDRLADLQSEASAPVDIQLLGRRPAGRLPRDTALLVSARAIRRQLGLEDVLVAGSTDANAAIGAGIPAISLGVARGNGMHTIHESIEVASLALGCEQLAQLVRDTLTNIRPPKLGADATAV